MNFGKGRFTKDTKSLGGWLEVWDLRFLQFYRLEVWHLVHLVHLASKHQHHRGGPHGLTGCCALNWGSLVNMSFGSGSFRGYPMVYHGIPYPHPSCAKGLSLELLVKRHGRVECDCIFQKLETLFQVHRGHPAFATAWICSKLVCGSILGMWEKRGRGKVQVVFVQESAWHCRFTVQEMAANFLFDRMEE